jgi:sporulation protein YlmC with PRC-barrel domain
MTICKKIRLFTIIWMVVCLAALPAFAQEYARAFDTITEANRIQPLQNPGLTKSADVLDRRLLDRTNKVVGVVQDVVVQANGSIAALNVDFDRLRLGAPVFVNYNDMSIRPGSDSYIVGFADDEIETLYPTLLANVETAAGEGTDIFSVKQVLGTSVKAADGRDIGVVQDILFGAEGGNAEAIYINLKTGLIRGKAVAVPFTMADLSTAASEKKITIGNEQADALLKFASEK